MSKKYTTLFDNDEVVVDRDDDGNYRISFFEDYHWKDEYFYYKHENNFDVRKYIDEAQKNLVCTTTTNTSLPKCCQNCPNRPKDGNFSICNCAAPYFEMPVVYANTPEDAIWCIN